MAECRYWLFKSEPSNYSFDDLLSETDQTAEWDGVRNYQARNLIRDDMKVGDGVLFYHSSTDPTAVVGTATIAREAYPDSTAWDPQGKYYDPTFYTTDQEKFNEVLGSRGVRRALFANRAVAVSNDLDEILRAIQLYS